jgi:hypothetical protein
MKMNRRSKIFINPKLAFVGLSIAMGVLIALLVPALYRILTLDQADAINFEIVVPDQLIADSILGFLAGVGFSIYGLTRFDGMQLVKLIRIILAFILMLIFLTYITIKSAM